jgi:type IV pilus assembly protein PilA
MRSGFRDEPRGEAMIDWYYHDPGEGRIGPLSAEELRKRFQERRIQRDTLVWHHGLREWQPLERMAPDIGLETLRIDTLQPPPLPANAAPPISMPMPPPASATPRPASRSKYSRAPLREKKTLPSAAIVLIVAAVLGIPALLVMGSMMLSGYRDYAQRATRMGSMDGLANGLKQIAGDYALRTGSCLRNDDPRVVNVRNEIRRRFSADVRFATIDGGCAFEVAVNADGTPIDGKTLRYEGYRDGNEFAWECSGGTLAEEDRPYECRTRG